jgi:hypothetical protein
MMTFPLILLLSELALAYAELFTLPSFSGIVSLENTMLSGLELEEKVP